VLDVVWEYWWEERGAEGWGDDQEEAVGRRLSIRIFWQS
jgi:hypothetical protein